MILIANIKIKLQFDVYLVRTNAQHGCKCTEINTC
jgi:hypothetical protein